MHCPYCKSNNIVMNGSNGVGTPKLLCKNCLRQFVENPKHKKISNEQKCLIDKLLLEKISLAGIARVVGVSERWLQNYVNDKYDAVPRKVNIMEKVNLSLTIECDELWSFVGKSDNKQWVWLAIDRDTREIVGMYIGDRSTNSVKELWNSLPLVYQQTATGYTDFWNAYQKIFPTAQHYAVGKETGHTNYVERFNCILRQRVSRLVRKTLSFSKKLDNHIGAIWYFIYHCNDLIREAYA